MSRVHPIFLYCIAPLVVAAAIFAWDEIARHPGWWSEAARATRKAERRAFSGCREHIESQDFYRSWACLDGYNNADVERIATAQYKSDREQQDRVFDDCINVFCAKTCSANTHRCSCRSDGGMKCELRTDVKYIAWKPMTVQASWSKEPVAGWVSVMLLAQKSATEDGVYWVPEGTPLAGATEQTTLLSDETTVTRADGSVRRHSKTVYP